MVGPPLRVGLLLRTVHWSLAQIPDRVVNLTPPPGDFLEDQIRIPVKGALYRKDLADAVAIQIEMVNKIYARKESLRRRLISLKLGQVSAHTGALELGNQKQ